jgi:hypothetical protein
MFYIYERWVNSNLTFRKCWENDEVMGIQTNVNSGNGLIMLHVGEINVFLPNAQLIYRAKVQQQTTMDKRMRQILRSVCSRNLFPAFQLSQ